ncbi:MAG: single-stranded DNA-binding protein, partial [Rectinema sp.]|nr:single-stranded DNA-binding protein [Rectinema sp.]
YGENKKTFWFSIACFDKQSDVVSSHVSKGDLVMVEGSITISEYDKDGVRISRFGIVANNVVYFSKPKDRHEDSTAYHDTIAEAPPF